MSIDYPRVYLSGPDIYYPNAAEIDARKKSICERFGMEGISSYDGNSFGKFSGNKNDALNIFRDNIKLILSCDVLIATLNPFRGPSADVGTALEMGVMVGLERPIVAYTHDRQDYVTRLDKLYDVIEEPLSRTNGQIQTPDGVSVENFELCDVLMVAAAALDNAPAILDDFETAVHWARRMVTD